LYLNLYTTALFSESIISYDLSDCSLTSCTCTQHRASAAIFRNPTILLHLQHVTSTFTNHIRVIKIPVISLRSPPIYICIYFQVIQSYFLSNVSNLTLYYSNTYFGNTNTGSLYPLSRLSKYFLIHTAQYFAH
jgi:hypothetical protein